MAHFAELDENNVVLRVTCVGNDEVAYNGDPAGETYCTKLLGGTWKQTSYNHNFRKQFAGIGMTYDATKDKFISAQPHASWALDGNDDWQAPITKPSDGKIYAWNETAYQADNTKGWDLAE